MLTTFWAMGGRQAEAPVFRARRLRPGLIDRLRVETVAPGHATAQAVN
jgi:hypothetical protein